MQVENKKIENENSNPDASSEEQNEDSQEREGDTNKNVAEPADVENLQKELEKVKETLKRAEFTIVKLKKEEPKIDLDSLKNDLKSEISKEIEEKWQPKVDELSKLEKTEKENRELKETLSARQSVSNAGAGASVPNKKDDKPKPNKKDIEIANKYFGGDVERYMKYKVN